MSETGPILQLTPAPAAPEPEPADSDASSIQQAAPVNEAAPAVVGPMLDESQLTDAEKKAIDDLKRRIQVKSAICLLISWPN